QISSRRPSIFGSHNRRNQCTPRPEEAEMRYALMLATDDPLQPCHEERTERFAAFAAFIDEMHERGVLADHGLRLQPTSTATAVTKRDGELVIADGPFAETKEQIVGLFLVDCEDLDE